MDGDSYPPPLLLLILLSEFFVNLPTPNIFLAHGVVLILIFFSALMSASEVAFFSLTKPEIDHLKESENKTDNLVVQLMEQPRYLLSTILISNNLVNIGVVILSYFITKQMLNFKELSLLGWIIPGYALEFIFNVVVVTFVLVLFGEATPKVYATHHKFSITRLMAPVFSVLVKVFQPINWLLIGSTQVLEKRLKKHNAEIDLEEINKAIEITVENENSNESKEDARILKGVVQFGNITVKQIMRPRMEIVALDDELKFNELIEQVKDKGYSRMPVYKESIDNIVGILYIKDLLEHLHESSDFHWQKLLREPFFVPETKRINDLLRDFQKSRKHLAVVVDEFGGTKGLVTLEDIVEEVVGDIKDEFDEAEPESCVRKISDNLFVAEGKCLISELTAALDLPEIFFDEVKGDSETLGGLVLELMGKIPEVGEICHHEFLQFTVSKVEQNRVSEVKILLN